MIKNLKSKIIICLFLLVTVFSVTSSCFASVFSNNVKFYPELTDLSSYEIVNVPNLPTYDGYDYVYVFQAYISDSSSLASYRLNDSDFVIVCLLTNTQIPYYTKSPTYYNSYGYDAFEVFNSSNSRRYIYNSSTNSWTYKALTINWIPSGWVEYSDDFNWHKMIYSNIDIYAVDDSSFCLYKNPSVEVSHEFQSDTSAKISFDYSSYGSNASVLKYSLTGVELNTDLTAPLELKNPVTYTPRSNKFSC